MVGIEANDQVHVGMILDMQSIEGKIFNSVLKTAIADFYDIHDNYTTRLVVHVRDTKGEPLEALSAGRPLSHLVFKHYFSFLILTSSLIIEASKHMYCYKLFC